MLGLGLQILSGLFSANTLKKLSFDGLLSGAWFHKKAPTDEIVDETPDVDTSRTWHKARALQFTGSEYVETDGLQIPNNPDDTFRIDFEFISGDDGQVLIICDGRSATDVNNFVVIHNDLGKIKFRYLNKDLDSTNKTIPNTRYKGYVAYDPSSSGSEMSLFVDGNVTGGGIQTAARTHTSTTFDDITFGKNNLIGSGISYGTLGWIKFTFDNIVTAEYAFEEGEGTTCYNRVMNNFHGTINNATISTFRVEDVRITNGDQGTFLNTDGYSPLNTYTSDFRVIGDPPVDQEDLAETGGTGAGGQSIGGVDDAYKFTTITGTGQMFANAAPFSGKGGGSEFRVQADVYLPSTNAEIDKVRIWTGYGAEEYAEVTTTDSWVSIDQTLTIISGNALRFQTYDGSDLTPTTTEANVFYLKNIVVTQVNVYVPRPRVTDIPLYNAGKYAYYIPDHANNFIDLNTAFAGLTNDGDWMEFGIATVGTGEPDSETAMWAESIDGSDFSRFYAKIDNTDFRFYAPANNTRRMQGNLDLTNEDFYSFRVTKNYNTTTTVNNPPPGTIEVFDRDGNLIKSQGLEAINSNEGTYTFDRFFPSTYSTDFILAYLKLSDGTVWNGANDFNGGVNITNTGTGNVTKIFFESVDEDVLGNPLTYKGQVAQPLSLVNSNGALFSSGVLANWDTSKVFNLDDFTMVWYAYLDEDLRGAGSNDWREAFMGVTSNYLFYFTTNGVYFRANNVTSNKSFLEGSIPSADFINKWQRFSFTRSASNDIATFTAGDVVKTVNLSETSGLSFEFKGFGDLAQEGLQGQLAWASVHSKLLTPSQVAALDPYNMDTDSLEVFLVPSVGSGSTIYDLSGNNRHSTVTNATLSNFWIKQNEFHWNLKKGFSEVYSFDGVDDNIIPDTPLSFTGDFFIDFDVFTLASEFYIISSGGEYFRISFGSLMLRVDSTQYTITTGITINTRYIGRLQRISGVITCTLNGVNYPVVTTNTTIDFSYLGSNGSASGYTQGIINYINVNNEYIATGINFPNATINGGLQSVKVPYTINGNYTNPAGKWHNDAETEINFPHTAKLQVINEQFDYKPFFYKNAQLDDATVAYSLRKVRSAYTGSAIEVRRSSNGDTLDIGFDANGDLDTTALTEFVGNNLCSNPNEWANGSSKNGWTELAGSVFTFVENVADPDGGTNATRITRTATGYGSFRNTFEGFLQEGEQYTFSVYLRSTNSAQVVLDVSDQTSSPITLDSTWTLYTHTITQDSSPQNFADFEISSPTDGVVEVYNPMINHGATALPFEDNASSGAGFGYVTTWYDQTQNDPLNQNNATQSDPAKMPLIVEAGDVVLENGKPAIQFDGVDDMLQKDFDPDIAQPLTLFHVRRYRSNGLFGAIGYDTTAGTGYGDINVANDFRSYYGSYLGTTTQNTNQGLWYSLGNGTSSEVGLDGATAETGDAGTAGLEMLTIGSVVGSFDAPINTQEIIIFNSDQSSNRQDIEKNIADYYEITLSGNSGVESWVKNVSFADMYQTWNDYEYLHRLFANFEIPNKVFKVLAYTSELTADQRQQVYDYLQKNYHPIYTPYSTRVLADGGTLAAGQTNTLTIIDSI